MCSSLVFLLNHKMKILKKWQIPLSELSKYEIKKGGHYFEAVPLSESLQISQRNASVQSLLLAGNLLYNQ